RVDDALVRHAPLLPLVDDGVVGVEPVGDVIGVQDGDLRGPREAPRAHHPDVGPGNEQDAGASPGRRRDGTGAAGLRVRQRVSGQERRQVRGDADRSHAGAAAAVRDAEGLVQVDVADVGADVAGAAEADLRVQVGAVHVDLAAVLVDDGADLL